MELQSNIKRLRKARGWSLQDVGKRVGISKTQTFDLENGYSSNPTLKTLLGLCEAFEINILELLYEKELLKNTNTI